MKYHEKLLPNQKDNSNLFDGDISLFEYEIFELTKRLIDWETPEFEHDDKSQSEMGSSIILQDFLNLIIMLTKSKRVLEIGTFVGMSAIAFARANVNVDTIEKYESFATIARKNIVAAGFTEKIRVLVGNAIEILPKLNDSYDLIFIDGDKVNYKSYFNLAKRLLSPDGIIIVDDLFFHGDVFNSTTKTERGEGVKKLINELKEQIKEFRFRVLPISNGVLIAQRR